MNLRKVSATVLATGLVSLGLVMAGTTSAHAEDYESFTLRPGFLPDPVVGTGLSGGPRNVGDCGWVDTANAPDHVLALSQPFSYLRLYVVAPGDVTLYMQNAGTGETICVDDSNGTLLPDFSSSWPAGTYNIWIGDFENNSSGTYRYQMYITEQ